MEPVAIGRELRARRTSAGRTVASVAADAGLSVPYIANLENGRGNPTIAALTRFAGALGLRLEISLAASEQGSAAGEATSSGSGVASGEGTTARAAVQPGVPVSLVRLGRTARFRQAMTASAAALSTDASDFSRQVVLALAMLAQALGRDLTEGDWWRLLDAVLLVAVHPGSGPPNPSQ